jgi:hypothetical protein
VLLVQEKKRVSIWDDDDDDDDDMRERERGAKGENNTARGMLSSAAAQ